MATFDAIQTVLGIAVMSAGMNLLSSPLAEGALYLPMIWCMFWLAIGFRQAYPISKAQTGTIATACASTLIAAEFATSGNLLSHFVFSLLRP